MAKEDEDVRTQRQFGEEDEGEEIEIEVVEDKDKVDDDDQDGEETTEKAQKSDDDLDEDERKNYGQRAQKRIKNLVGRAKAAEEQVQQALLRLQEKEDEIEALKTKTTQTEDLAYEQAESSIESETASLEAAFEAAHDEGDRKKLWQITNKLAELQTKKAILDAQKGQRTRRQEQQKAQKEQDDAAQKAGQTQQVVDPRELFTDVTLDWMGKNTWFLDRRFLSDGTQVMNPDYDPGMTAYAYQVHDRLNQEGVELESEEYWDEIDQQMRSKFPDKFGKSKGKATSPVASGRPTSSGGSKGTKIRLTADQVAFCERNNLDKVKYARELAKLEAA